MLPPAALVADLKELPLGSSMIQYLYFYLETTYEGVPVSTTCNTKPCSVKTGLKFSLYQLNIVYGCFHPEETLTPCAVNSHHNHSEFFNREAEPEDKLIDIQEWIARLVV